MRLIPRPPAVLVKELQSLSRRNSTFIIRSVFGLCASAALLLPVYFTSQPDYAVASISREVCQFFLWCQGLLLALTIPAITASAIASERERDTLGILLMTAQGPLGIILSKLTARLLYLLLLLATAVPAMLILASFGGLSTEDLLLGYLWTFTIGLACVGVSIALSAISSSIVAALIGSYIVILILGIATGITTSYLVDELSYRSNMRHLPEALASTLIPFVANYGDMRDVLDLWPYSLAYGTVLFLICTLLAVWLLPRGAAGRSRPFLTRVLAAYDRLMAWKGRWGRRLIRDRELDGSPLYWHEVHRRTTARNSFQIRLFYIVFLVPLGAIIFGQFVSPEINDDIAPVLLYILMAVLIGGVGIGSAVSFIRERGQGNFSALLSAPISPWSILTAKTAGIAKSLLVVGLVAFYFLLSTVWSIYHNNPNSHWRHTQVDDFYPLLLALTCFLLVLVGTAVSGFAASLRASSTLIALARTFGGVILIGGISLFTPGIIAILMHLPQSISPEIAAESFFDETGQAMRFFDETYDSRIREAIIVTLTLAILTFIKLTIFAVKYPTWLYDERST